MNKKLGISGRIAKFFQDAQITPLLAILALLMGLFAIIVTPREEEPQINVTMANVLIPFPGASAKNVEEMVSIPAEQVLSQIAGIEHVMSMSQSGLSVITVQFKVGVPRTEALVRLHDTVAANSDWLPKGLGIMPAIIKPKGIDDVPILSITLFSKNPNISAFELEKVANQIEVDIKRVKGTREVSTIGGPKRAIRIEVSPEKMALRGITIPELRMALETANLGMPVGDLLTEQGTIALETGPFLKNVEDVEGIALGIRQGNPIYIKDIAAVIDGPIQNRRLVWHADTKATPSTTHPAVTISVTKKPGENAVDVSNQVLDRLQSLKSSLIPQDVDIAISRNYGETANEKASKLIQKLIFATLSVVALIFFALGRREAMIVGSAVVLTLAATLFASWAWGFTINRVSLFALIFSIGILVDDAIVVVENIHRHQQLYPTKSLRAIIPGAVDEVGGPTILATLTVIAALLPMAFISGLMGPYMSPIPINSSMGMLLSLAIAFIVTPWMAKIWLNHHQPINSKSHFSLVRLIGPMFHKIFEPLLNNQTGKKNRKLLAGGVIAAIFISLALPVTGLVVLKMLPFDNKSEFQVILDMPPNSRVEKTSDVLKEMGMALAKIPEVESYQIYAGTAAPINFNGLVRQYYFRQNPTLGDIQVNLVDKHHRKDKSHLIASKVRPELETIAQKYGANVKVVEVPPGPPVLSPIVAEIYGPTAEGRQSVSKSVRKIFEQTDGIVDIDDSSIAKSPKQFLVVDRRKASLMGVSQQAIVTTLRAGLAGEDVSYIHDESKYPAPVEIRLPEGKQNSLEELLKLTVRNSQREAVPLSQFVTIVDSSREQVIYHKDLLPVSYVIADTAGKIDSPLYGLFKAREITKEIKDPSGKPVQEFFTAPPNDPYQNYSLKWDGEWQVTYETFRDMGAAYAVGLVLIYLLVVAHFGSYLTPLIIMAPIPLTIIGVMPGHALLGAQFTATSMIGMIALAGIIVRNSILLVDFISLQVREGMAFKEAVVNAAITRAQPIALTGLAAMLGAFFILDDPIFNGLAISLIFGILVSTALTLVVIPLLYYSAYSNRIVKISSDHELVDSAE